jgi:threonine/homoserine/homoserine lactone efflux protein
MAELIFDAVAFGLSLALFFGFGPVFFTLLQTSLDRGFRSAFWMALGVLTSDLLMISICVLTSIRLVAENDREMFFFSLAAGIILFLFGYYTYTKRGAQDAYEKMEARVEAMAQAGEEHPMPERAPSWFVFFGKGILLNILNPFVMLFWFSAVAVAAGNFEGDKARTMLFFAIVLCTSFCCDLLKAKGATFLKRFFNARRLRLLNQGIGIALMVFGVVFIIRGIVKFL